MLWQMSRLGKAASKGLVSEPRVNDLARCRLFDHLTSTRSPFGRLLVITTRLRYQARVPFTRLLRLLGAAPFRYLTCSMNARSFGRSEEHTSELQSRENLVCRL